MIALMDNLVGTQSCPHLGFDLHGGRPCCHADDSTRIQCGKFAPNPAARNAGASGALSGVEAYFCTVLGTDALPAEAMRLAAAEKAKARRQASEGTKFRPPSEARGRMEALPDREAHDESDPIIPTHTLRAEGRQTQPNEKCPCGSGKKYKKCCGRMM